MIEWFFNVKPMHAAINPARKCRCVRSKKTGKRVGQPFTRDEYKNAKEDMHRDAWASLLGGEMPVYPDGPVHVEVVTHGGKQHQQGAATGLAFIDADATTKCVLDALNGVAYTDDAQVQRVTAEKTLEGQAGIRVRVFRPGEDKEQ